jgi:hypothetical protein
VTSARIAGTGDQRLVGRESRRVGATALEEHLDGVRVELVVVHLDERETAAHAQQLIDADLAARIAVTPPGGHVRALRDVDPSLAHQNADHGMQEALGHGPRGQRGGRVDARTVPLDHDASARHDQQGVRRSQGRDILRARIGEKSRDVGLDRGGIRSHGQPAPGPRIAGVGSALGLRGQTRQAGRRRWAHGSRG